MQKSLFIGEAVHKYRETIKILYAPKVTAPILRLARATENVVDLMLYHVLDCGSGGSEILTGIEMLGMLCEVLTDGCGHRKTEVGVDINLADSHLSCLCKLGLGDTDSVGHVSAVGVDFLNELLRNG